MGLVTLPLPWIFASPWPVIAMGVGAIAFLLAIATIAPLRSRFGGALGATGRPSIGEFAFPVGIALMFVLAHDDPVMFVGPVLTLTLADAAAALFGVYFGRRPVTVPSGKKSIEGSAAFYAVAVLCVQGVLVIWHRAIGIDALLLGLATAATLVLLEAVAVQGFDNLLIPLATWAELHGAMTPAGRVLVLLLGGAAAVLLLVLAERFRGTSKRDFPQIARTAPRRAVR
jgi:phytol kinase